MIGTIHIFDLKIMGIIGVNPNERVQPQELILNVELDMDFSRAARSDNITHTIDYDKLSNLLENRIQAHPFHLLEALALEACEFIMTAYPQVEACRLSVRKPGALKKASSAAVSVSQQRK